MSGYDRLRELLPSLYRPELEDETLLNRLLAASGFVFDGAADQAQQVLRGHWFNTADKALLDSHYQTERRSRGLEPANVRDAEDAKELRLYPYITDLARLCALLNLPPWSEPSNLKETTEEYRLRVEDLLAAYRLGLTTLPALRRMVEAALPEDMAAPPARQRWSFAIEEPRALKNSLQAIRIPEVQEGDAVSPLYRWTLETAGAPTLYLQGTTADATLAATVQPAFERYTPGQLPAGIALAYCGTVAAGQTLRLRPSRRSWLLRQGKLCGCAPENAANAASDPSANGPWTELPDLPTGTMRLMIEATDHSLWCALEENGSWSLYHYDGSAFTAITQGLPAAQFHALQCHGAALYLGTDQGLYRCPLFPDAGQPYALAAVPAVPEAIRAFTLLPDGTLACAGSDGLAILDTQGGLKSRALPGVSLQAVHSRGGQLYLATPQALLLFDQGRWFVYEGAALSENLPDWQPLDPAEAATAESPLPPVQALATTRDGSLWLGTACGLARYYARQGRSTILEAYPDLGNGPVLALPVDERGLLWLAGEDGLFRFDGRDLAQHDLDQGCWISLGLAEAIYPDEVSESDRDHWRYNREQTRWERYDSRLSRYVEFPLAKRSHSSDRLDTILFTASVRAELGQFDGTSFTGQAEVDHAQLAMRIKPSEERIVDGGLPAMPAYCAGAQWRYLQLEPDPLPVPSQGRPWWSCEGRLFPPPGQTGPFPGHFRTESGQWTADGRLDESVFAYPPSVRLWMAYPLTPGVGVRVRLFKSAPEQTIDPALMERVWSLLVRAKAAGVPLELAVEGSTVKGE
ncbi:MAG: hypothetical protein P8X63_01205 [Desulfuromonadaceae bacterium]